MKIFANKVEESAPEEDVMQAGPSVATKEATTVTHEEFVTRLIEATEAGKLGWRTMDDSLVADLSNGSRLSLYANALEVRDGAQQYKLVVEAPNVSMLYSTAKEQAMLYDILVLIEG